MVGSLCLAAALLLGGAGLGKLRTPQPAAAMLRRAVPAGLRPLARAGVVRAVGVGELAVGVAAVLTGDRSALVLLAVAYLAFLGLAVRLLSAPTPASCGCFGRVDSPVGVGHVVLNLVAAGAAVAGAVRPVGSWGGLLDGAALPGVVGVGQSAVLAVLGYLAITALPALSAARRQAAP